jgi:hypothetical protein
LEEASAFAIVVPRDLLPIMGDWFPGDCAPLVGEGGSSRVNLGCGMGSFLVEAVSSSSTVYV